MKVLIFTDSHEDYLADAVVHGFRSLFGKDCVDFPKCEILYKNCPDIIKNKVRGKGFTLYSGLLEDIEIERYNIKEKILTNFFDLIIFSNIQRQFGFFTQYRPYLNGKNTIVLDGSDTTQPYPARGFWWRKPYFWSLPKAHKEFLYFKREYTSDIHFSIFQKCLPKLLRNKISKPKNLRSISFAIPKEKIVADLEAKTKVFPKHIVDEEVSSKIKGSFTSYAFDSEKEYYHDLQISKYGITIKRAGWDCLRHYEIAANGGVMCFKDLDSKPDTCAPHGLDASNSICYKNYQDLKNKIDLIGEDEFKKLQANSLVWIKNNSTEALAKYIIGTFHNFKSIK